jgi:hypothetical protein
LEKLVESNQALNNHTASDYQSLETKLEQLKYLITPGTRLYIVTDLYAYTPKALKALAQLSAHSQITLFAINDPLEIHPPCSGATQISLGNRVLSVVLGKEQQHSISEQYQTHKNEVTRYLNGWNIPLVTVTTTDNPITLFTHSAKTRKGAK